MVQWKRARAVAPLTAALILTTVSLLLASGTALASCNPGRSNTVVSNWAGTQQSIGGVNDIASSIQEYIPYVTSGSEVMQWVMLSNGSSEWAQVGWWQDSNGHRTFEQHTDNSGHWYTNYWPANGNGYNGYEVSFNASQWLFGFYRNGSLLNSPTEQWTPTTYDLYGETHRLSDQMPGGYNNPSVFMYAMYNHTTYVTTSALSSNWTYFAASYVGSGYYNIWDRACPS